MKKIRNDEWTEITDRYYKLNGELLLEIENSMIDSHNINEHVSIGGEIFIVSSITHYPELAITDYNLAYDLKPFPL